MLTVEAINYPRFICEDYDDPKYDEYNDRGWPRLVWYSANDKRSKLKPGWYIQGDEEVGWYGFETGYETAYELQREICRLALGVELEDVWAHPRRFRGKPFVEFLLTGIGGGVELTAKPSAKIAADFIAFEDRAMKYFRTPRRSELRAALALRLEEEHPSRYAASVVEGVADALGAELPDEVPDEDLAWLCAPYRDFLCAFDVAGEDGFITFD